MNFSIREKEVLQLIAYEFTTDEIALRLHLSSHTVISHRKNMMEKMRVRNVAGLIRRGFELGLLNASHVVSINNHLIK